MLTLMLVGTGVHNGMILWHAVHKLYGGVCMHAYNLENSIYVVINVEFVDTNEISLRLSNGLH